MVSYIISRFSSYLTSSTSNPDRFQTPSPDPNQNHYILDDSTSATFTLPDGRKLGYATYGSPTGKPIFDFHGLPGSRKDAAASHDTARKLGARLISVDRPGIGWSSPHPNRTLTDHARDVELLAEYLKLDSFGVLGISGGGPYALACAATLPPEKLKAVTIVCGLGSRDMGYRGMMFLNFVGFSFLNSLAYNYWSYPVKVFVHSQTQARFDLAEDIRLERFHAELAKSKWPEKDAWVFAEDPDRVLLTLRTTEQAYRQGFQYYLQDAYLASCPFDFRIEDIRKDLPIMLWYGKQDTNVPLRHGEQIAARIGGQAKLRVEDETHMGIVENWREEWFAEMVKAI